MSNFIYDPPQAELSSDIKEEIFSFVGSKLPFKKIMLLATISTFIGVFIWVIFLFITLITVVLIDESIIDEMSSNMAVAILMVLVIPGSLIANIIVLLNLKLGMAKNA